MNSALWGELSRYQTLLRQLGDALLTIQIAYEGDTDKFHRSEVQIVAAHKTWEDFLADLLGDHRKGGYYYRPILERIGMEDYRYLLLKPVTRETVHLLDQILNAIESYCASLRAGLGWTW